MRLFVALPFGEQDRAAFRAVQDRLRTGSEGGTFPPPENFHLTLAFLGEVEEERMDALWAVLKNVPLPPLDLTFHTVGQFEGNIWHLAPLYSEELFHIQAELAQALTAAGFTLEDRPYVPHLTLARKLHPRPGMELEGPLEVPIPAHSPGGQLFLSHRVEGVLTYTPRNENDWHST